MTCGGCWIGCADGKRQCARGIALSSARSSEEHGAESIACDYKLHLSADAQVVRLLQEAVRRIGRNPGLKRTPGMRFVGLLAGHGGWMSLGALRAHAGFSRDEAQVAAVELRVLGLVEFEDELASGTLIRLTDRGCVQDAEWRTRYDSACAEFAVSLSEDECQQLVDLLVKLRG